MLSSDKIISSVGLQPEESENEEDWTVLPVRKYHMVLLLIIWNPY
jgi:hypothetical protein